MKRVNTASNALNTKKAIIDVGDGLVSEIPLGVSISVEEATAMVDEAKWNKPNMPATADFDNYITVGKYAVTSSANKTNIPALSSGFLEVSTNGSVIVQHYTTTESRMRKFERRRSAGVWDAWRVASLLQGGVSSAADLNTFTSEGIFELANSATLNKPHSGTGVLFVFKVSTLVVQWVITLEATQREFLRRYTNDGWTEWRSVNNYQGVLPDGVDFDSLTDPSEWATSFVGHKNIPVARVGTLTISRSGGEVVQEYTPNEADPVTYRRRKMMSTNTWTSWVVRTYTDAPANMAPTRGTIGKWNPTMSNPQSNHIITEFSADRTVGFNGSDSSGTIKETRDDGVTWTTIHKFDGSFGSVQVLDNGELLCAVMSDPSPRELWVSEGYGKPGETVWTKVLTASAPYITFAKAWSFSVYKNMIFVNEYGPKLEYPYLGNSISDNARYTYMSLDYGKTWKTIFDLNSFLIDTKKVSTKGVHLHGVAWDPYWDRIWITFGDDVNGTVYSDDLGETWRTAHFSDLYSGSHQNVGIIPMPKCVLFATDTYPNGVQRINRSAGKHSGTYTIEQAYTINPGVDDLTHLAQAVHKVNREGGDGPLIIGYGAETATVPSCIIATYDGYTFTPVWEDSEAQAPGRGLRSIAGPNLKGELIVSSNDGRVANKWTKFQGPIKIY